MAALHGIMYVGSGTQTYGRQVTGGGREYCSMCINGIHETRHRVAASGKVNVGSPM